MAVNELGDLRGFLQACGLQEAILKPLAGDASARRYFRISGGDKPYLLMVDAPYETQKFAKIAEHLHSLKLHPPTIYHRDAARGFLLLQDFGDDSFRALMASGHDRKPLYHAAVETLLRMHGHAHNTAIDLPYYTAEALYDEAELFPLWYMRHHLNMPPNDNFSKAYKDIILDTIAGLPRLPECLVLRDYHVDNIMRIKPLSCGLLDFQDALIGSPAYDLMSVLEDARISVPENIRTAMLTLYLNRSGLPHADFIAHYNVLAVIRHLKVLGIFTRLNIRDNKPQYIKFLPHVKNLLQKHLNTEPQWQKLHDLFLKSNLTANL